MSTHAQAVRYAAIGVLLGSGGPLGWLGLQAALGTLDGGSPLMEVFLHWQLYLYLAVATPLVFAVFGAITGSVLQRLARANVELAELAVTDGLTHLKNARHFHDWLRIECARADRTGAYLSLVVADVDFFKRLNDEHGHAVGDRALALISRLMAEGIRAGDVACRIGGEEFAFICSDCSQQQAMEVAERIRSALATTPLSVGDEKVSVTASFGVATYRRKSGPSSLFDEADAALYRAKGAGRNRVVAAASQTQRRTRSGEFQVSS